MKPAVYIETTIVSYLTAWPSRDVVVAGHQQVTLEWWRTAADRFELVASELVVREAEAGDEKAARSRLEVLSNMRLLDVAGPARDLAGKLIAEAALPPKAGVDAAHIAVAATGGADFLVTWNCRHIANASMRKKIYRICEESGHTPPTICTPDQLIEPDHG